MAIAQIKSLLATGLKSALEAATGETVQEFAFTPSQLGLIFEQLPVVLVDDDLLEGDTWSSTDQAQYYETHLYIEMFCELSEGDYGAASDVLIHEMKEAAEAYLLGQLPRVLGSAGAIEGSKVEQLPVETVDTGILMRFGWIRLSMQMHP